MAKLCPHRDRWCFVCARWIKEERKTTIRTSRKLTEALFYSLNEYFGAPLKGFKEEWAPQVICSCCFTSISAWRRNGSRGLSVKTPTGWSAPREHQMGSPDSDCFFCRSNPPVNWQSSPQLYFEGCVTAPVFRDGEKFLERNLQEVPMEQSEAESDEGEGFDDGDNDPDWTPEDGRPLPYIGRLDQGMLDYLVQMLQLPKEPAEFLGSFLLNAGLLTPETKIGQRERSKCFEQYFAVRAVAFEDSEGTEVSRNVVVCTDINGLLHSQGVDYQPEQWRLFMDGSQRSFKCFLLHNEPDKAKRLPSLLILIGNDVPEKYEAIKEVLALIDYASHGWLVQADLKMINIISGLKMAACKYPCFLCKWDSRDRQSHYHPGLCERYSDDERRPGRTSFIREPLVAAGRIVLPELHIKLGVFQSFIKRLFKFHQETPHPAFEHYKEKFKKLSDAKLAVGAVNGVDVRRLVDDVTFAQLLRSNERSEEADAWQAFVEIDRRFFGKDDRPADYQELVRVMLAAFERMGCLMSLKVHLLAEHLEQFPVLLGTWSDQHGERGHQEILEAERLFPHTNTISVMTERMHQVKRPTAQPSHSKYRRTHF
ncbi:hypothetical protein TYRP_019710 [Tyrophagus putrescentiae]|nr:hypothetical protein TYRP_019710 [Tyrophagus putrescentiae]